VATTRIQRSAVTGLLIVCVVLGGALVATAVLSHHAATAAARDVLHSRAAGVAASFVSTARLTGAWRDGEALQQLARETAQSDEVGVAVIKGVDGRVEASAGAGSPGRGATVARSMEVVRDLRLQGQSMQLVDDGGGQALVYWRAVRGGGPHRGRGRWRWFRPGPPPVSDRAPAWKGPHGGRARRFGFMRRLRLVRISVPMQAAGALLGPARITTVTAGAAAVILLLLGVLMHRAARRAQRAEEELRRREALSALGEMAAVLAHEIRTPLGSIKGNAQLIGEGAPDDERVAAMVREAGRLERLVNGLLDYARPQPPRRQPGIDPDQLTTRAAEIVAPKAAASSVNVVTDLIGAGACLQADPDQLLQVLVNLLQNAVEACTEPGAGGDNVVVRVRAGRGEVTFTVLDQGPGLSQDLEVEALVRPFFSTKEKGTGLGLSVAMQIARQHGGELTLRQRKEGGAEARLVLPKRGDA